MGCTADDGRKKKFIAKDGTFGLRLPEKERQSFLKKYKTQLCEAYGIVLKEYVLVPDKIFKNTDELKPWFQISFSYIKSLKRRATTKAKK